MKRKAAVALLLFALASGLTLRYRVVARRAPAARILPGPQTSGATRLFNGWTITPAGTQANTAGDMLTGSVLSPDGKLLAVISAGFGPHLLNLLETATGTIRYQIPLSSAWNGVVWTPDGKSLYLSGGRVAAFSVVRQEADGQWTASGTLALDGLPHDERIYFAGLAISPRGDTLYAANCAGDSVYALHLPDGGVAAHVRLPPEARPYAVRRGADGLIYVAEWGLARVAVLDPVTLATVRVIPTGGHPNDLLFAPDGRRFYVSCANADAVYEFDTRTGLQIDRLRTTHTDDAPAGATPCALAQTPDGRTLFVADADGNDVAVLGVGRSGRMRALGFIPTGWYPTTVGVSPDGRRLFIGSGKGRGTGHNVAPPVRPGDERQGRFMHVARMLQGTIATLPVPRLRQLRFFTRQVLANSPYRDDDQPGQPAVAPPQGASAIPSRVGDPSPIKHVVYIIKENRTYDQVLGDMAEGNGDPDLTLFGEQTTPNHHALARQFVLLDNLYCNGEVSVDGHSWSTAALATDFSQRTWTTIYGGKGAPPATEPLVTPPGGFLWDACARKGVSFRSYGEYGFSTTTARESVPLRLPDGMSGLRGHTSLRWARATRARARDLDKAQIFLNDLRGFERAGTLPQLIVMSLGEDHTRGTGAGQFTPRASVAANDDALGRIVAACAASRFWHDMAIFVIEDDAQNGPDHVDAHRTVGFAISPYTRRSTVDSTFYTTASFLRTMELILGLPPLSQYDAGATPLYASFGASPDLTGYVALPPRTDLNARNTPRAFAAARMRTIDFSGYDHLTVDDEDALNQALWYSIKGADMPYPGTVSRLPVPPHPDEDDEEAPAADDD